MLIFVLFLQLIFNVNSQSICLENTVLRCYCNDQLESVDCFGLADDQESFVDWSTFTSTDHRRYLFTFVNLTRLTSSTLTHFSSTFAEVDWMHFIFIDGLEEIGENALRELEYFSDIPVDLTFTSPRKFQLADDAFGRAKFFEVIIEQIQDDSSPYLFNLKSMDGTQIFQMTIRDSGRIDFISNGSTTIEFTELTIVNCSLTDVNVLIDSLSPSIVDLDLSSNLLTRIPSMSKFQEMREIDLSNNFIEEIPSNVFNDMENLVRLELSNNRIRQIAADAFLGLTLTDLGLNFNQLLSLETINSLSNETTSFLYPINSSLAFLSFSSNSISRLTALKAMSNLVNVTGCCNQIDRLDENTFLKSNQLETLDLSYNPIKFIHPMALNGTRILELNFAGNLLSSLESDGEKKNVSTSFLSVISSTVSQISLFNSTNLFTLNWFVVSKLSNLYRLDLSGNNKTEQFWSYRTNDVNNTENATVQWNYPPGPTIFLHGMRFTDEDYCLTRPIAHIMNATSLALDADHPCNCFVFKFLDRLDLEQRPDCLRNQSAIEDLNGCCAAIDEFCQSMNTTSTVSTQTTVTQIIQTTHSTTATEQHLVTSTQRFVEKSTRSNEQTKIILSTVIPVIFTLTLGTIGFYLIKRERSKHLNEGFEMHQKTSPIRDQP